MSEQEKLNDFDSEPVVYCSRCYSLNIVYEDAVGTDCCGECGCSDMLTSNITEWEKLYTERYGHKFVEARHDVRKSPIFLLSISKLKAMVFNLPEWKEVCKTMYPGFPELCKSDSVILLFAKLCQDNRLDDLRIELINRNKK